MYRGAWVECVDVCIIGLTVVSLSMWNRRKKNNEMHFVPSRVVSNIVLDDEERRAPFTMLDPISDAAAAVVGGDGAI